MRLSKKCPYPLSYLHAQAESVVMRLRDAATSCSDPSSWRSALLALETLARLCWSDDEAREAVVAGGAINALVTIMRLHASHAPVQAAACMCLMALVRGEGEVCLANQWHVAKVAGVEAVVAAMDLDPADTTLQLAALLCLIPLALDNSMMQVRNEREREREERKSQRARHKGAVRAGARAKGGCVPFLGPPGFHQHTYAHAPSPRLLDTCSLLPASCRQACVWRRCPPCSLHSRTSPWSAASRPRGWSCLGS